MESFRSFVLSFFPKKKEATIIPEGTVRIDGDSYTVTGRWVFRLAVLLPSSSTRVYHCLLEHVFGFFFSFFFFLWHFGPRRMGGVLLITYDINRISITSHLQGWPSGARHSHGTFGLGEGRCAQRVRIL